MTTKTIAVDLDDTLNNFTETLLSARFGHDSNYAFSQQVFDEYMVRIRSGARDEGDLLSTEYSFFRYRIHQRCYELAQPRADGVEFMRWLRSSGWRIVICTARDLRRAGACTREWLGANGVPFDHLFMAWNKVVFCRAWGIADLVDDEEFNIVHGGTHGVNVYYPIMGKHGALPPGAGRGFSTFDEVRRWIER